MTKKLLSKAEIQSHMQIQANTLTKKLEVEEIFVGEPMTTVDSNGNISWIIQNLSGNGVTKITGKMFAELLFEYAQCVGLAIEE